MVKRDFSRQRLILALILTVMIFSLGVTLGVIVDYERLNRSEDASDQTELNYESLQLQYLFLSQLDDTQESCPILRAALQSSVEELGYSLDAFERYQQQTFFNKERYHVLQRKYLQDNLRYWMFSSRLQRVCDDDVVNILYFYSEENCTVCPNQGTVLTYYKQRLDDRLLVFPLNMDLAQDEKFLSILQLTYNVTEYPTLIINDEKYVGVHNRQQLGDLICEKTRGRERCLL